MIILYFAYGSNMNLNQMRERCGQDFEAIGLAQLLNYEVGFDERGFANVRFKQGDIVWGVLFDITESCQASLDRYEGYPGVYDKQTVSVRHQGKDVDAVIYIEKPEQWGGLPKPDYLRKIIDGAKENKLPTDWVRKLHDLHYV